MRTTCCRSCRSRGTYCVDAARSGYSLRSARSLKPSGLSTTMSLVVLPSPGPTSGSLEITETSVTVLLRDRRRLQRSLMRGRQRSHGSAARARSDHGDTRATEESCRPAGSGQSHDCQNRKSSLRTTRPASSTSWGRRYSCRRPAARESSAPHLLHECLRLEGRIQHETDDEIPLSLIAVAISANWPPDAELRRNAAIPANRMPAVRLFAGSAVPDDLTEIVDVLGCAPLRPAGRGRGEPVVPQDRRARLKYRRGVSDDLSRVVDRDRHGAGLPRGQRKSLDRSGAGPAEPSVLAPEIGDSDDHAAVVDVVCRAELSIFRQEAEPSDRASVIQTAAS